MKSGYLLKSALPLMILFFISAVAGAAECGKDGLAPCGISPAEKVGQVQGCPTGSFFDPVDFGSCWSCPPGHNRTAYDVKGDKACSRPAYEDFEKADKKRKNTKIGQGCPDGQFWDVKGGDGLLGACYSCGGYNRTAYAVTHKHSCSKRIPESLGKATKTGSPCPSGSSFDPSEKLSCWKCPDGFNRNPLSPVTAFDACYTPLPKSGKGSCDEMTFFSQGECVTKGVCGKKNQRPCSLSERLPSCDVDLYEDFKQNLCLPLAQGQTPFTAGLASLSEFYGDSIVPVCRSVFEDMTLKSNNDLAVGVNCGQGVLVGAGCEYIAEKMGRGAAKMLGSILNTPAKAAEFQKLAEAASQSKECAALKEDLYAAKDFGPAKTFMACDRGQKWDLNGRCYSCEKTINGKTAGAFTGYPVTGDKACVDNFAGDLRRTICGVHKAADQMFLQSNRCTLKMIKDGEFFEEKITLENQNREFCMAAGEFSYSIYGLVGAVIREPQSVGQELTTSLQKFIAAAKKAKYAGTIAVKVGTAAEKANKMKEISECGK